MRRIAQRLAVTSLLAVTAAVAAPVAERPAARAPQRPPCARLRPPASPAPAAASALTPRKLRRAAAGHAGDMVAKRYFAHDSKSAPRSSPASSARAGPLAPLLDRRREHRLRLRLAGDPALDGPRLDEQRRPPREHPRPPVRLIGIGVANGSPLAAAARPTPPTSAADAPRGR